MLFNHGIGYEFDPNPPQFPQSVPGYKAEYGERIFYSDDTPIAEDLLSALLAIGDETKKYGEHPDNYVLAESGFVFGPVDIAPGLPDEDLSNAEFGWHIVTGANWNPISGKDTSRTCAFAASVRGGLRRGDRFGGLNVIDGPHSANKLIVGSKLGQRTVAMCGPCRPRILSMHDQPVAVGIVDGGHEIVEAYYVEDAVSYHDEQGPFMMTPEGKTLDGSDPYDFALDAVKRGINMILDNTTPSISIDPKFIAATQINPLDRS